MWLTPCASGTFATRVVCTLILAAQVWGQNIVQSPLQDINAEETPIHRIAIIGAGAGGSSAAFHLAKFHNETETAKRVEIDIFETNSMIGGRTTTVNALNDPRYPTELGASIFVTVNHVLYNLTRDFELSTRDKIYQSTGALYDLGVWDGSSFVFTINNDGGGDDSWKGKWKGYWDIAKLLWKYGLSPIWTQRLKDKVVGSFLKMYDEIFPIASLTNFAAAVGLSEYTGITGQETLLQNSISEQYAREIVQSSTRVNYAQNLDSIHGLETMVCMAIEGVMAIEGGNWQIFDRAVHRSGAKIHLNTTVTDIAKKAEGKYQLQMKSTDTSRIDLDTNTNPKDYDTIILASPYQFSNLTFHPPLAQTHLPEKLDYVTLHVTLFTSPHRPAASYFNLSSQDQVPDSVLTTLPLSTLQNLTTQTAPRGSQAIGPTKFWSLSTLRTIDPINDLFPASLADEDLVHASKLAHNLDTTSPASQPQYLYKIFSPEPLSAEFLSDLFGWEYTSTSSEESDPISILPKTQIHWFYEKVWHSYPYLPPRTEFPGMFLDSPFGEAVVDEFERQTMVVPKATDAYGIWYTSGVEAFISTMETSALMGRNIARIIVDGLVAEGKQVKE